MSNLRLINETEITSAVRSVNITDVFSADFDIYKIVGNTNFTAEEYIDFRLINSSGSVVSASSYDNAGLLMQSSTTSSENKNTNVTKAQFLSYAGDVVAEAGSFVTWVFNPYSTSSYTFLLSQGGAKRTANTLITKGISVLKQTSSITGFQLLPNTSNVDNASLRTYGLRVDS
jgi:hypothetical protein